MAIYQLTQLKFKKWITCVPDMPIRSADISHLPDFCRDIRTAGQIKNSMFPSRLVLLVPASPWLPRQATSNAASKAA